MKYLPEISVIVCTYNHAQWIERCIRSLSHQEHMEIHQYEIIVVDDGSDDNTSDVLDNFKDIENIRIIRQEYNLGLPTSLNNAIRVARGRYVVRVDSDDYVSRPFLHLMRLFLDMNREYQAVATDYVLVDRFENIIERKNCIDNEIACGIMFRKECLFEIGLYNEEFLMREGHELKRRFIEKFKLGRLEFPLYKYRQHDKNRTKNTAELINYDIKLKDISKITEYFRDRYNDVIDEARNTVFKKHNLRAGNNVKLICEKLSELDGLGTYVECGVFKGNTFFTVAEFLQLLNKNVSMYGCDTFEGFPVASTHPNDQPALFKSLFDSGLITEDHFVRACKRTEDLTDTKHLDTSYFAVNFEDIKKQADEYKNISLVKGKFTDTLYSFAHKIDILFLDCDLYESYMTCLEALFNNIKIGGTIIFDEYFSLKYPGAMIAVHEFLYGKPGYLEEYDTGDGFKRVCFTKM